MDETAPATFAPSASARALASLRVIAVSVPVNTMVLPAKGEAAPSGAGGATKSVTVIRPARSSSTAATEPSGLVAVTTPIRVWPTSAATGV